MGWLKRDQMDGPYSLFGRQPPLPSYPFLSFLSSWCRLPSSKWTISNGLRSSKFPRQQQCCHFVTHQNIFIDTSLDPISTSCSWTHFKWNLQTALQVFGPINCHFHSMNRSLRTTWHLLEDKNSVWWMIKQLLLVWYHRWCSGIISWRFTRWIHRVSPQTLFKKHRE